VATLHQTQSGLKLALMSEHDEGDCARLCEERDQRLHGHETVYEAKDASSTRATVGYSKTYADNFDSVFGKN
jgi:hypothetical protein